MRSDGRFKISLNDLDPAAAAPGGWEIGQPLVYHNEIVGHIVAICDGNVIVQASWHGSHQMYPGYGYPGYGYPSGPTPPAPPDPLPPHDYSGDDYERWEKAEAEAKDKKKCKHEFVNMGFMSLKMVCKLCDKEKDEKD